MIDGTITGRQRLRNIKAKIRLQADRRMRDFAAGRRHWLPCVGDELDAAIAAEFERLARADHSIAHATTTIPSVKKGAP